MAVISKLYVHEKQLSKFLWFIMARLLKMECERKVGMMHAGRSKTDVKNLITSKLTPVLNC